MVVWSSLFTIGSFLYGRTAMGLALLATFLVSGSVLMFVINRLWRSQCRLREGGESPGADGGLL